MVRTALRITALILSVLMLCALAIGVSAADSGGQTVSDGSAESIPDDTLITYGYIQILKQQLKEEIINELRADGGIQLDSAYADISASVGQLIVLGTDAEVIYRGGGAVAITASPAQGDGIIDMSEGVECFSGASLQYGHIYFASESDAKKCILVTGETAYFTIRGSYELG